MYKIWNNLPKYDNSKQFCIEKLGKVTYPCTSDSNILNVNSDNTITKCNNIGTNYVKLFPGTFKIIPISTIVHT